MNWFWKLFGLRLVSVAEDEPTETLESTLTVTERVLLSDIEYLRAELTEANNRCERLAKRLRVIKERPAEFSAQPVRSSEPIQLGRHKSLDARRAELEELSLKRFRESLNRPPEEVAKENYWKKKASQEEQLIFQEMSQLEDKLEKTDA